MTDANWIFDAAIRLMDEQHQVNGETRTGDTEPYRLRTLGILNVLRHELYPYSDTFEMGTDDRRAVCPRIMTFDQPLDLDDVLAQTVLPYGLAAHLLLGEHNAMADFFLQRYRELLYGLGGRRMGCWEEIG
jgi:hypothetical protein